MLSRSFTLAAGARMHHLVVVLLCCGFQVPGELVAGSPLRWAARMALPETESAETEQSPSPSSSELEATWALPRTREFRRAAVQGHSWGSSANLLAGLRSCPASPVPGAAPHRQRPEHAQRCGLGAPLRL
jgi:hypothetical protein